MLRVALFVEGSHAPPPPRPGPPPATRIWNEHLAGRLGRVAFSLIEPISKKHLLAMDPSNPRMSGAAEGLDQLIVRKLKTTPFDAAVVAWDLIPAWNPAATCCRRQETLRFYELLSRSPHLDDLWREAAGERLLRLGEASPEGAPRRGPPIQEHQIVALCMEPMFEGLLTQDETSLRKALSVRGRPEGWPTTGWGVTAHGRPDSSVLTPVANVLERSRSPHTRKVRGDFRTNKDGWGEYFLRLLLDTDGGLILGHPLCARLRDWLPPPPRPHPH